jgi:hypothetical protein
LSARRLDFAGSCVTITWQGQLAERLVRFLFQAVPEAAAAASETEAGDVGLHLQSEAAHGSLRLVETVGAPDSAGSQAWYGPAGRLAVQMMERATFHLADRSRGGALLHAAGLAWDGKALVLPGSSGAGKSSLALHLACQGARCLSDELLNIPAGTLECAGLARPLYLKSGARGLFPQLASAAAAVELPIELPVERLEVEPEAGGGGGMLLAPERLPGGAARGAVALAGLVFPQYQAGAEFSLRPLSKGETAVRLAGVLINARNLPENGFPELLRIARSAPAYEIHYSSFAQIGDALLELLG